MQKAIASRKNAGEGHTQPYPNVSYMGKPAIGNKPPKRLRITLVAASALAAYLVKASTMYICVGTWVDRR